MSRTSYTLDELREAVAASSSYRELSRRLGLKSDNLYALRNQIDKHGLSASHFTKRWRVPLGEALVKDSSFTHTGHLKERLLKEGFKEAACEECGLTHWRNRPISFHLHHMNGDWRDNRIDNLQLLCPNCHDQTDTFGVRNAGKGRPRC